MARVSKKSVLNIMYCSAEVEPFAKSGGLGDVLGALPKAVASYGHNVSVVMPKYGSVIKSKYHNQMKYIGYMFVDVNWRHQYCGVFKLEKDNVTYYFIDNEYYFNGDLYCFADNERFTFFSKACLDLVQFLGKRVDVLHCNDWSTALIPVMYDATYRNKPNYENIQLVYTIHNLRYQGWMDENYAKDVTGLPYEFFTRDKLIQGGNVNLMKGGIVFSNMVTTVSPTYAQEIKTDEYSEWLGDVINQYSNKIVGFLNGVDYSLYNPSTDDMIFAKYDVKTHDAGKKLNKTKLQQQLGLPVREDVAVIGLISRLVDQKGIDLLSAILDRLLVEDIQLIVVGTGEHGCEEILRRYGNNYPNKMSANIMFDNTLAHRVYAACDMFLVPSRFEPCGLSQLISLKYGTLPIVRETGGLKDTVMPYNQYTNEGNGFSFTNYNSNDFLYTIKRAIDIYYNDKPAWKGIVERAMKCDYSWDKSCIKYIELYSNLCGIEGNTVKPTKSATKPKATTAKSTKEKAATTKATKSSTAKSTTAKAAKATTAKATTAKSAKATTAKATKSSTAKAKATTAKSKTSKTVKDDN